MQALDPGAKRRSALPAANYQQQGSMPAQHAAPATQHDAANAATEKVEAPSAAMVLT